MEVAAVAFKNLKAKARKRAAQLLKVNPSYANWIIGAAAGDEDRMAFMRAATWPDAIKSDPSYRADDQTAATASQNIGYADRLRHTYWHYVNRPFSPDGTPLLPPSEPNAETVIPMLRAALSSASNDRRCEVLRSRVAAASRGRHPPAASLRGPFRCRRSQGRPRWQQRQDQRQRSAADLRRSTVLPLRTAGRSTSVPRRHRRRELCGGSGGGGGREVARARPREGWRSAT